jgi:hypothetical protein
MYCPLTRVTTAFAIVLSAATLAACSTSRTRPGRQAFDSGAASFTRSFDASSTDSCEAARRALLSQGYMAAAPRQDGVDGTKNFQPSADLHLVVAFHVVCTPGESDNTSILYVNAVQDGYQLKKTNTSASVGLSVFGSLSVPIGSTNDAMVKVSSETIPDGAFYDGFFELVARYLRTVSRTAPVPDSGVSSRELPPAAVVPPGDGAMSPSGVAGTTPRAMTGAGRDAQAPQRPAPDAVPTEGGDTADGSDSAF